MRFVIILIPLVEELAIMATALTASIASGNWEWMWLLVLLFVCQVPKWMKDLVRDDAAKACKKRQEIRE